jgi:hypothetical protein
MGHDLPHDLWPTFANAIDTNAGRTERTARAAAMTPRATRERRSAGAPTPAENPGPA